MPWSKCSPDVAPLSQPTSTSCWYTCLEMLFRWKKRDPGTILSKMDQSPNLYPWYMLDEGIAPSECKETAKMLGLGWAGDGELDAGTLARSIATRGPYWVAGMWTSNYSHVIVVTACNPNSGEIKYINPWCNYDLSESGGSMDWLNRRGNIWKQTLGSVMYW